jgi:cytochrome c oxidase assembly factor CtaG
MYTGDFSWGMQLSTLLFFVTSLITFDQIIHDNIKKMRSGRVIKMTGYAILTCQFIWGCIYLVHTVASGGRHIW